MCSHLLLRELSFAEILSDDDNKKRKRSYSVHKYKNSSKKIDSVKSFERYFENTWKIVYLTQV